MVPPFHPRPAANQSRHVMARRQKPGANSRPIKIGPQSVRWRRSELQSDIDRMIAERDSVEAA